MVVIVFNFLFFYVKGLKMDSTLKKVLIVEDLHFLQAEWTTILKDKVSIISAFTVKEAEEKFSNNPDIDLISMDGCVPGEEINTQPLVRKFRKTFKGPIIAASRSSVFREFLKEAGCDYECTKNELPKKILEILGI